MWLKIWKISATGVTMHKTSHISPFTGIRDAGDHRRRVMFKRFGTGSVRLLVLMLLLLANTGCAAVFSGQAAASTVEPGTILFSDDFSDQLNGWGVWDREGGSVAYHQGGLRILVKETQFDFWSVAGRRFEDVQVEVDAARIGGPDDNDFGLICRYVDKDNFYLLVVSSDGYYGIAKVKQGQYSMIGSEQLQYSGAIAGGQAVNRLSAVCVGSTLTLYANGIKLMEAEDSDFTAGDVGVLAGAYNTTGVEILFDNFMVKKP